MTDSSEWQGEADNNKKGKCFFNVILLLLLQLEKEEEQFEVNFNAAEDEVKVLVFPLFFKTLPDVRTQRSFWEGGSFKVPDIGLHDLLMTSRGSIITLLYYFQENRFFFFFLNDDRMIQNTRGGKKKTLYENMINVERR